MMRHLILGAVLVAGALECQARIGETEAECQQRYGKPVNQAMADMMPILNGAVNHSYSYQGWNIRVAFVNGKAVRVYYSKLSAPMEIKADEVKAILEGEANGGKWEEKLKLTWNGTLFAKAWLNTNGSIGHFEGICNILFIVDTPDAQAFFKAKKEADEQKRKGAIPKF